MSTAVTFNPPGRECQRHAGTSACTDVKREPSPAPGQSHHVLPHRCLVVPLVLDLHPSFLDRELEAQ